MCVLILSTTLSQIFLTLRKNQPDIIVKVRLSSRKVPAILVRNKYHLGSLYILYNISSDVEWNPNCFMWTDRHGEANNRFS